MTNLTLQQIKEKVEAASWFQTWEIVPGVKTKGVFEFTAGYLLDHCYNAPRDLKGKRAIDIGTFDGALAFELEKRGADVIALDIQDPDVTGFNTAKEVLGSSMQYVRGSVYDVRHLVDGSFDIVCFTGIWYHLYNPIGAFVEIAGLLADDGLALMEGECLLNYIETSSGGVSNLDAAQLAKADVPIALCYPGRYKNGSNWFVPNIACLRSWLEAAGLEAVTITPIAANSPDQRATIVAKKKAGSGKAVEHPVFLRGWRAHFDRR